MRLTSWILILFVFSSAAAVGHAASTAPAAAAPDSLHLPGALSALQFLIGRWAGQGAGSPGPSSGGFTFSIESGGRGILRRGFNDSPSGRHQDLMIIYQDPAQGMRALYLDSEGHVIDYAVPAGESDPHRVEFLSSTQAGAPRFRLRYALEPDSALLVSFAIAPPGSAEFKTYIEGKSRRL